MSIGKMALVGSVLAVALATPAEVRAAEAANCVDEYLGCINVASQESGAFWRSAKEFECGVEYYACIRRKAIGA